MTDRTVTDATGTLADERTAVPDDAAPFEPYLIGSLAVAAVVGVGLSLAGRQSALLLLIAVAIVQGLVAVSWVFGTGLPGRRGALVLAAMAAGGADATASVWPHGRLGVLVAVLGLAVPVMFVHQLTRGAARTRIVASLSAIALLVVAQVALASLLQLRHEFVDPVLGGKVVSAVVAAAAAALVIGYLVDMVLPLPRFDPQVPRGLPALVASAVVGGAVAVLMLRGQASYAEGRGAFVGAALGALAGLLAIAAAFVLFTTPEAETRVARALRPAVAALLPLCLLAPAAFLLCLAIRT